MTGNMMTHHQKDLLGGMTLGEIKIKYLSMENIHSYGLCGYKNAKKHEGFRKKISWLINRFDEGLRVKILDAGEDGNQGMIEYLPGEHCWRPVDAKGYMFIQCIAVGFDRSYKNKGHASTLIQDCIRDAKEKNMHGVCVVTRKGSFMVGKEIFIKNGFQIKDTAKPDFELLAYPFNNHSPDVTFNEYIKEVPQKYKEGVFILRSDQCPYSVKNVNSMIEVAKKKFNVEAKVINITSSKEAQRVPSPFGTFAIIMDGKVTSYHPISAARFETLLQKSISSNELLKKI
jgi:hypothetical protein